MTCAEGPRSSFHAGRPVAGRRLRGASAPRRDAVSRRPRRCRPCWRSGGRCTPMELSGLSPAEARDVSGPDRRGAGDPERATACPRHRPEVPQVSQVIASGASGPLAARLYRPALAKDTPVILYFVGGTWVTGTLDSYDESARQLAARTGYVVVSLRTRLAPEGPFPAAHDDAFALYQWARAHMREWGARPDPGRACRRGTGREPGHQHGAAGARPGRRRVAGGGAGPPAADHPRGRDRARDGQHGRGAAAAR